MVERVGKSLHEILEKLVKGMLKEPLETVPSNFNQDLNGGFSSFYRFVVKGSTAQTCEIQSSPHNSNILVRRNSLPMSAHSSMKLN